MDWDEIRNWAESLKNVDKVKIEENQIHIWSKYGYTAICKVRSLE